MIPMDFSYWRTETAEEAVAVYQQLADDGQHPVYYAGGTEVVTRARLGALTPGAVIDVKAIPEARRLGRDGGCWHVGAALSLADLIHDGAWPLLARVAERVADHTTRSHITLGGNLAGTIAYREAALPFWLADADVATVGPHGRRTARFRDRFDGTLALDPGELVVSLSVPDGVRQQPSYAQKATRLDYVDYPLVTIAALRGAEGQVHVALSGLKPEPFRSAALDAALIGSGSSADRAGRAARHLPATLVEDLHGTADYRRFVAQTVLADALTALEGP
ncbi:MAG: FAD binding domain-containing protein [Thermaerobacter sp.]|nr:FAD binding domain-containing protein [Thermaerobacter sp.]